VGHIAGLDVMAHTVLHVLGIELRLPKMYLGSHNFLLNYNMQVMLHKIVS